MICAVPLSISPRTQSGQVFTAGLFCRMPSPHVRPLQHHPSAQWHPLCLNWRITGSLVLLSRLAICDYPLPSLLLYCPADRFDSPVSRLKGPTVDRLVLVQLLCASTSNACVAHIFCLAKLKPCIGAHLCLQDRVFCHLTGSIILPIFFKHSQNCD